MIWRRAPVRLGVRVGDGHDDPERRALGARREPLVAVDHPLVAVAHRARPQRRRVGARAPRARSSRRTTAPRRRRAAGASAPSARRCRTCHRISALPASGAWQPKTSWRPERAPDLLVQVRVDEEAPARAAGLGRQVRRPEPLLLRTRAEPLDERLGVLVLAVERRLVRVDVLLHERAVAAAELERSRRSGAGR